MTIKESKHEIKLIDAIPLDYEIEVKTK